MNTAKKLLKLSFTQDLKSTTSEPYGMVPAHGKRTLTLRPNCRMTVEKVEVYPKGHRMTFMMPDPKNFDTGYSPMRLSSDGAPEVKLSIDPAICVIAVVENPTDRATHARVVLTGRGGCETFIFTMSPSGDTEKNRRIAVAPHSEVRLTMQPPVRCRTVRVAIRSDSDNDVMVNSMQFSNLNMLVGLDVPVEYFAGEGAEIEAPLTDPANRITFNILNLSDAERWVEVDIHVDTSPVARTNIDLPRANNGERLP